jgi:ribulose-phosphate 3-epimerase
MSKLVKIVPAILVNNKAGFKKQFDRVKKDFKYIQVDIMDGILVKEKNAINPQTIKPMLRGYKIEIHLMVKDVTKYIEQWRKLKNVKKIVWHYEAEKDSEAILCLNKYLRSQKIQTGLAINPNTSLAKIKNIIPKFHTIQIMGIKPGAQGRTFQPKVLKKIKSLRKKYPKINIAVDGGVDNQNFSAIKKAGANIIAIGSYLQKSKDIKQALKKLPR